MDRWLILVLLLAGLAGCMNDEATSDAPIETDAQPSLRADCTAADEEPNGSVCVNWIREAGAIVHYEPHLAAHPTDSESVLLSAMVARQGGGITPGAVHVVAGTTNDGGASWPLTSFHDAGADQGSASSLPFLYNYAFDAISRYDSQGNPLVNFGGTASGYRHPEDTGPVEGGQRQITHWQMTLARSLEGSEWQYEAYHENPAAIEIDDYMDFDVAPEGTLYVVTDTHGELDPDETASAAYPFNIQFWRSADDGETWQSQALASAPTREEREFQFPRIAAGANGLVVVTAQRFDPTGEAYEGVSAWISSDGGVTFNPAISVTDVPSTSFNLQHPAIQGERIDIAYATKSQAIHVVRSEDRGATWGAPFDLAPAVAGRQALVWESAIDPATGDLFVLHKGAFDNGTGFFLDLLRWNGAAAERLVLADLPAVGDGGVFEGGHYAGLDIGIDGSVWVAWADPRPDDYPIAVARLVPTPQSD